MNKHSFNNLRPGSLILLGLLLFGISGTANGQITIGGQVFGGGKEGNVIASGDATEVTIKNGTIAGNIYGGGEKGDTDGNTNVIIQGGGFTTTSIFGGACQADVNGSTNVLIDGANIKTDMEINKIYGGNDVSGNISGSASVVVSKQATQTNVIYVHDLYAGGNGDYDYSSETYSGLAAPTLATASLNILSGCYDQVFGGGNNANVTTATSITLNNDYSLQTNNLFANNSAYQFKRVFGGNNKVNMGIQPTWTLTKASILDLYSGGNRGAMTNAQGISLAIASADMTVKNLFGGCRMADVNPGANAPTDGYGTHVTITAGNITNVYGGNDISGDVYYGTHLDILSSIIGDVYGGGNGSYSYTDNEENIESEYYYNPGSNSVEALNLFRPNAARVFMHIAGTDAQNPTYVGGSVYCGGNSATLRAIGGALDDASAIFKIGSYAILNQVFLGSNGENMISADILEPYADHEHFSSLDLTSASIFDKYMKGVEVAIKPFVSFDDNYVDYSTNIGSLYCGGNVGSMSAEGTFEIDFLEKLVIFQKLVGGCNKANVDATAYNAAHQGGLITQADTKVQLLIEGLQIQPKKLTYTNGEFGFNWNESNDSSHSLLGGNIYGGCYQSGYINGSVVINLTRDALEEIPDTYDLNVNRDNVMSTSLSVFGGGYGLATEVRGNTTINISDTGNMIKIFGGGELGLVTGNATINMTSGNAGKIYGGGFEGLVHGNTAVYLDGGQVYDAFAGSCNANIEGSAKILLGSNNGNTHVLNNVYGGNDFGGTIVLPQTNSASVNGVQKNVKSNTYVKYQYGLVDGNIFGGSCGSYDYSLYPDKLEDFVAPQFTTDLTGGNINANSFVDIDCSQTVTTSAISGGVFGGGLGRMNTVGIVDMNSTYVLLRSSDQRNPILANDVFGGGYYSKVGVTTVDAVSGCFGSIFGGSYGASTATPDDPNDDALTVNYSCEETNVTTYAGLKNNANLTIYGGGSFVGANITHVTLNGGKAGNVYGGSFNEGYCHQTNVTVPAGSDASVRALFGGSKGSDGELPCDVNESNVIFASNQAYVARAIYGGNHSERATKNANVTISSPVYKSSTHNLATIYGGGLGKNTVTGTTKISLENHALVDSVFGGGQEGKISSSYDIVASGNPTTYYDKTVQHPNRYSYWDNEVLSYTMGQFKLTETETDQSKLRGTWRNPEIVRGITFIDIKQGATVQQSVYGGGYGSSADVTGSTYVKLDGGTVEHNIYGGGFSGKVFNMDGDESDLVTYCQILGGSVTNVYGGGFQGNIGIADDLDNNIPGKPMKTMVEIGSMEGNSFYNGKPTILHSAYGGGEEAEVNGTSRVKLAGGYVGYRYENNEYVENLGDGEGDLSYKNNGNLYGAGYGEGATVDRTEVYMYEGKVRNGLYGGGEIAAVGHGSTHLVDGIHRIDEFIKGGSTHIYMYGGHVVGDVFGGGRGFSYTAEGNEIIGHKNYTDGYVFGSTDVNIYRGTVGTQANIRDGFGNVFGGGNIGYVYADPRQKNTTKKRTGETEPDGYYYALDENGQPMFDDHILSEDCRVLITAYAKALETVTIDEHTYQPGEYVPTEDLHKLNRSDIDNRWEKMDSVGIIIENAVFAGGNVSSGSDKIYANATTIFGNATASVVDLYPKDFILISNDGIGGIYGDGNLTFVDGYRELNITNYGTDYYTLNHELQIEEYNILNRREKAYYELKYKCKGDYESHGLFNGEKIKKDAQIPAVEYEMMDADEKSHWAPGGFTTLYSGRMMNTIQRCDFCGVFGSRIILRGAQDRVPDVVDYTKYTMNRVGELSLNKSTSPDGHDTQGNYFGVFNVVNLLGAVTSDVDFQTDVRQTTSVSHPALGDSTYMEYKANKVAYSYRNNGSSHNMIALASGVFLEIVKSYTDNGLKNYGPITGVIELDLVNIKTGEGGGYVYAQNIHGTRHETGLTPITLASANRNAISNKAYSYDNVEAEELKGIQTSGNFVHSAKRIVDDCHPVVTNHNDEPGQCHYWYIKGDFYVYNQYISAYTSASQAFTKPLDVSMVVTPQANGLMQLVSVKPNKYAYFIGKSHTNGETHVHYDSLTENDSIYIESTMTQYKLNDPISDWDYLHLSAAEKQYFKDSTYVFITDAEFDGVEYSKGKVLLPKEYNALPAQGFDKIMEKKQPKEYIVRETNALSNEKGFLLTMEFNNPEKWDKYYTTKTAGDNQTIATKIYNQEGTVKTDYIPGATLMCTHSGIYGRQDYEKGFFISSKTYNNQNEFTPQQIAQYTDANQPEATFSELWLAKEQVTVTIDGVERTIGAGGYISTSEYDLLSAENKAKFCLGLYCDESVIFEGGSSVVFGELMYSDPDSLNTDHITIKGITYEGDFTASFSQAYICETSGKFGGQLFLENNNYQAVEYCNLDSLERKNYFVHNYDAFDALRANFKQGTEGLKLYSHNAADRAKYGTVDYAATQRISYEALPTTSFSYKDAEFNTINITEGVKMSSEQFELLPNEMIHWRPIDHKLKTTYKVHEGKSITLGDITFSAGDNLSESQYDALPAEKQNSDWIDITKEQDTIYVVKNTIEVGEKQYTSGHTISREAYNILNEDSKANDIDKIVMKVEGRIYYCVEPYTMGEFGGYDNASATLTYWKRDNDNMTLSSSATAVSYSIGDDIPVGAVVAGGSFQEARRIYTFEYDNFTNHVPNVQQNFQLIGDSPTEISTLYVPRQSVILDYNEDRIITVIYQYNYTEVYDNGRNTETQEERHIFNIRIHLEDGVPTIGEIPTPPTVLPSKTIGLTQPSVIPGAYNVLGGGWEIFENEQDAKLHRNGQPYESGKTPMYWYNDGYLVEYYAKTYAGKTYSNPATLSVANYHRLEDVMKDPEFLHIDTARVKRAPKIYIDNHTLTADGMTEKSELDLLYELYNMTLDQELNFNNDGQITGLANTEIILQSNVTSKANEGNWPQLGATDCFAGNMHGQGYSVFGLDKSLFKYLCGNVYNLGVEGTFTKGGIADMTENGTRIENTWVVSTTSDAISGKPVIADGRGLVVNSYYNNDKFTSTYTYESGSTVSPRPLSDFMNGSIAYDLNRYYLEKRWQDTQTYAEDNRYEYKYRHRSETADSLVIATGYYVKSYAIYDPWNIDLLEHSDGNKLGYIERFYEDGDYRYAQGQIRPYKDERQNVYVEGFMPIWPDDYILFGQTLAYDVVEGIHDDYPTAAIRAAVEHYDGPTIHGRKTYYENQYGRLASEDGNRVFRAQGYYGSSVKSNDNLVYFNDELALDGSYKNQNIHHGLTALDLSGQNLNAASGREGGYMPELDYYGLVGVRGVEDLTRNLLIYAPADDATTMSNLNGYFIEPDLDTYFNDDPNDNPYRIATALSAGNIENIFGHIVSVSIDPESQNSLFSAISSQFLVDNNDFNAPFSYKFNTGNWMWYQRKPSAFVTNGASGWESISLPFTADLVTTNQKGEITHFFAGSNLGHEYWLREYDNVNSNKIVFKSLAKKATGSYTVNNTFLYDYYYDKYSQKDANSDIYQTYYNAGRTYEGYPFYQAIAPYLIGFPGSTYYEFDMSGTFKPTTAYSNIDKLNAQTITFISVDNTVIGVSDNDYTNVVTNGNYTFRPTYQAFDVPAETTYALNATGTSFVKGATTTRPFRSYFTYSAGSGAQTRGVAEEYLYIDYAGDTHELDDVVTERGIKVWGEHMNVWIESTLDQPVSLDVVTVAGKLIKHVTVQPGTRISVPVNHRGVYLAGHKKVAVTR